MEKNYCEDCGCDISHRAAQARTCEACRRKRKNAAIRKFRERKKKEPKKKEPRRPEGIRLIHCDCCSLLEDCRRRVMEPKHFDPYCWVSSPYYSYYEKEVLHDKNTAL